MYFIFYMGRFFIRLQNRKWFLIFVIITILQISLSHGQSFYHLNIGVGGGLTYGGIGGRLTYLPVKTIGFFGSIGYNLDELGYNLGIQVHLPSEKMVSFYVAGMYGYNAVLIVEGILETSKTTFYGFSVGPGIQLRLTEKTFLSAEILLPFRPEAYKDAIDDFESIGYEIKEPLPVAFCIGYHINF